MIHEINDAGYHLEETDKRPEFLAMRPYIKGLGLDCGCGTNRLSNTVITTDWYPHSHTDLIWNCLPEPKPGEPQYFYQYPFREDRFDFIFASHVLEDFKPEYIQIMVDELLRMIKPGGFLVTIGPMMDGVRYPKWDEKFTADHPDVISGKRQVGECIGNPSHFTNWTLELCHQLKENSKYKTEIVQENTLPDNQMSIDFVLKKL